VWVGPSRGSHAEVLAHDGFRGGGFTRIDVPDDGEVDATFVPLTGREQILYRDRRDEPELRSAVR
jgi:hypothetical protein